MTPIMPFTAAVACAIGSLVMGGDVVFLFAGLMFAFIGIMSE